MPECWKWEIHLKKMIKKYLVQENNGKNTLDLKSPHLRKFKVNQISQTSICVLKDAGKLTFHVQHSAVVGFGVCVSERECERVFFREKECVREYVCQRERVCERVCVSESV